jgi:putative Mg2+ transporter-C (MgtC) family protein
MSLSPFDADMVLRLVMAAFLGSLVGLEREIHGRPAGFRTHLLVAMGSALFVVVSQEFYRQFGNFSGQGPIGVDPGRVAAQVVTGIGFLGAGAIIRDRGAIRGLTTAACLWITAAIGVACGVGMIAVAMLSTVLALASLLSLKIVERTIRKDLYFHVTLQSEDLPGQLEKIDAAVHECDAEQMETAIQRDLENGVMIYDFRVRTSSHALSYRLLDTLSVVPGIKKVSLK